MMTPQTAATTEQAPVMTEKKAEKPEAKNLTDVAAFSELRQLGWEASATPKGHYALELNPKDEFEARKLGPAKTIAALSTLVKMEIEKDAAIRSVPPSPNIDTGDIETEDTVAADSKGKGYLPTMEPKVPKKLRLLADAILNYDRIKYERVELSNQEGVAKTAMESLLSQHREDLQTDPKTGDLFYRVGNIRGILEVTEKVIAKTDHVDDE